MLALRDVTGVASYTYPAPFFVTVGYQPTCVHDRILPLDVDCISHHHAQIFSTDKDQFYVRDIGSRSGTFVNDRRLSPPNTPSDVVPLHDNVYLRFGSDYVNAMDEKVVVPVFHVTRACEHDTPYAGPTAPPGPGYVDPYTTPPQSRDTSEGMLLSDDSVPNLFSNPGSPTSPISPGGRRTSDGLRNVANRVKRTLRRSNTMQI